MSLKAYWVYIYLRCYVKWSNSIVMLHISHYGSCPLANNVTMHHHCNGLSNLGSIHFQVNWHLMQTPRGICSNWHTHFSRLGMINDGTSTHLEEMCQCFRSGRFIIVNSLCIQSPSVQFWDWRTSPSQSFPPFLGAGLLHSLLLHWVHSVPQADHLLQSVHTPSTRGKEAERILVRTKRNETKSNVLNYAPYMGTYIAYTEWKKERKWNEQDRTGWNMGLKRK